VESYPEILESPRIRWVDEGKSQSSGKTRISPVLKGASTRRLIPPKY